MVWTSNAWVVATMGVVAVAGCTTILGDDFEVTEANGATSSAMGGASSTGSTGGATVSAGGNQPDCELDTHTCVPDPGFNWSQPHAIVDQVDGCTGDFPTELGPLFDDLMVPSSSCDCTCGSPSVSCPITMKVIGYAQANCVQGQGDTSLAPDTCYSKLMNINSHALEVAKPNASCAMGTVAASIGRPSWMVARLACGAPAAVAACENATDTCVPKPSQPFQSAICVRRAGEYACPAGYPDRIDYWSSIDDTRACPNTCSCSAINARCAVTSHTYAVADCAMKLGTGTADSDSPACLINNNINPF